MVPGNRNAPSLNHKAHGGETFFFDKAWRSHCIRVYMRLDVYSYAVRLREYRKCKFLEIFIILLRVYIAAYSLGIL